MTFNINDPAPSDKIRNWPSSVTTNEWPRLHDIIDADHNFQNTAGGTPDTSGWHKVVRWINQAGAWNDNSPIPISNHGQLYTKTASGTEHLFYHQGTGGVSANEAPLSIMPCRSGISFSPGNPPTVINTSTVWNATVARTPGGVGAGDYTVSFTQPSQFYIPIVTLMGSTGSKRIGANIYGDTVYGNSVKSTSIRIMIFQFEPENLTDDFRACFVAILGG